jgi:invasion protein IalB
MVRVAVVALALMLLPSIAQAEKRIALLIGNQNYANEIGRLANPHNDVALLEKTLKDLHFEVTTIRDAGLAALYQAVNAYTRQVRAAGPDAVAFFYYSGHGAADAGVNYLIPVDVKSADGAELWDQSLRLTEITRKLKAEAGNATHFVVFDACRNTLKLKQSGSKALAQSKGFVPVSQESGMLIAYATAEGELASDVGAGAGPYARVLAEEIMKPGIEAVTMFRRVQVRVRTAIGQEPWLGFSALGEVHFAGLPPSEKASLSRPQSVGTVRSTHDQWQVRCAPSDSGNAEQCAVLQSITAQDRPNVGLTVIFLRSTDKKLLLRVLAPLGVLMPSGLGLKIDDKDIGRAGFTRCMDSGCVAEVIVDDNLLASFKGGKVATFIIFQTSEEGLGFPVSLVGFAASVADLPQ